jgi:hypothetical protein
VAPDLLEQDGGLDPAQAESALVLVDGDGPPALLGHRSPQLAVVGLARGQVGANLGRAGVVVQQMPGRVLEFPLVGGEVEVHGWIV